MYNSNNGGLVLFLCWRIAKLIAMKETPEMKVVVSKLLIVVHFILIYYDILQ